jgi:hypothetical protein
MSNRLKQVAVVAIALVLLVGAQAFANTNAVLNQTINDGVKSIDIVDATGTTIASPSITFGALTFSFGTQDSTLNGIFTSAQRVRVSNPTIGHTWTASLAGSAPGAKWISGANQYSFDDAAGSGYTTGQMTVDASAASGAWAGVGGCATTGITTGSSTAFVNGTTDSVTLGNGAAATPNYCRYDYTGGRMVQKIPAGQVSGAYALTMVVSVL